MIVFYKTLCTTKINNNIQRKAIVERRVKKITKINKNFLKALGFKV